MLRDTDLRQQNRYGCFNIKILIFQSCRSCRNCSIVASGCGRTPVRHEHTEGLETNVDLNGKSSSDDFVSNISIGGNEYFSAAARWPRYTTPCPSRSAESESPANKQVEVKQPRLKRKHSFWLFNCALTLVVYAFVLKELTLLSTKHA